MFSVPGAKGGITETTPATLSYGGSFLLAGLANCDVASQDFVKPEVFGHGVGDDCAVEVVAALLEEVVANLTSSPP